MFEMLAILTPLLVVFVIFGSLLVLGVLLSSELAYDFNCIFEIINGKEEDGF